MNHLTEKGVDDCHRARQAFEPSVKSIIGAFMNTGCDCDYCSMVKNSGMAVALVANAVRLHALAMGDMDDKAFESFHAFVKGAIEHIRQERDLLAAGNAPTSNTPQ